MTTLLVTGAAGNVGGAVVDAALARGLTVTACDRNPTRLQGRWPESVRLVRFDFNDASSWPDAVHGQSTLFLLRPPAIADVARTLNPFADVARAAGVGHVVFLSVAGVERNRWVPHRAVEEHLRSAAIPHTNLRPGFFAQNLGDAYRRDIIEDDRLYLPAGRGLVNWIDVRDIAEAVAMILRSPETHRGQNYTLTGPGPVAWTAVAATLSKVCARPIRYVPATVLGYVLHQRQRGLPPAAIAVQTLLHVLLRFGQGATVDPTLQRLLGRPGGSVHEYIREHASLWCRPDQGKRVPSSSSAAA